MSVRYDCRQPLRREKVRTTLSGGKPVLNGIDFLEVDPQDPEILRLHLLHPIADPPAPQLAAANFSIQGGVRIPKITVQAVQTVGRRVRLNVSGSGDFSTYHLRLHAAGDPDRPPQGFAPPFDSRLSTVAFSFKAACPSDLDCRREALFPQTPAASPAIDYLAKDYDSFRRLMLDRLRLAMPDWREESPADLLIALTELFAHVGDQLSYFQDAAAGEAYLHTARLRPSVRRHARLLDYRMHDGCNARTWVCFDLDAPQIELAPHSPLLAVDTAQASTASGAALSPDTFDALAETEGAIVFETCNSEALTLRKAHNALYFHTWSDEECCLPKGSTTASLVREPDQALKKGDILLFEEVRDPVGGSPQLADPAHRHAVRLVAVSEGRDDLEGRDTWEIVWHDQDALPFALCLHQVTGDQGGGPVSVARANVVLADHGRSLAPPTAALRPAVVGQEPYRPQVVHRNLTFAAPLDWETEREPSAAKALLEQSPRQARPDRFTLTSTDANWTPKESLLRAGSQEARFVVETENDGRARLRFGDPERGIKGRPPLEGDRLTASYRIGNGSAGNIGAEALTRIRSTAGGISRVRNPLPATGGTDPESLEAVKQYAPHRFRYQERAVTEADYAAVAERYPGVQKAVARFRWTGSWTTVFVTVDRSDDRPVDREFTGGLRDFLEPFRMAGYDLEVVPPSFARLDLALRICLEAGYTRAPIKAELLALLGTGFTADGTPGLFHPDRYTFGQAVYVSEITAAALAVEGVAAADVTRLQRLGGAAEAALEKGYLRPGPLEIIQMRNDPNFPEQGQLVLTFTGDL